MNGLLPPIEFGDGDYAKIASQIRRRIRDGRTVEKETRKIIATVRRGGDPALVRLTAELDGAEIGGRIRVSAGEIAGAARRVDRRLLEAMRFSLSRIGKTQGQLLRRLAFSYVSEGFVVRTFAKGLPSVGCYIPGGRAAYASTVLMTAGLAKLAGVKRIVVCTPPRRDGSVDDAILAAASICGVDEVYRVGGAQSIAALAYGTKSIARVAKVVGPGGLYVATAKRLVSSDVQIDFFAGPTEIVVVGDGTTDPRDAAWDLVGQAEHGGDTLCGLITWDAKLAKKVRDQLTSISSRSARKEFVRAALARGFSVLCSGPEEAVGIVNALAPEHLELMMENPREFGARVENAGLILSGRYAPGAASDYCVGTDHVIPTEGYASSRSSLSVLDFVKLTWTVEGSRSGLRAVLPNLKLLAEAEGLPNHFLSAESRFKR
jgi:histidinol dehydrogenase